MSDKVKAWLRALKDGSMSLDQLAQEFREYAWAAPQNTPTITYEQLATAELADPEPYVPDSFDDVTAAYHQGDLTDEQYDILANAMAESVRSRNGSATPDHS